VFLVVDYSDASTNGFSIFYFLLTIVVEDLGRGELAYCEQTKKSRWDPVKNSIPTCRGSTFEVRR